jgi:predicted acylesterase/phospholipase RssA
VVPNSIKLEKRETFSMSNTINDEKQTSPAPYTTLIIGGGGVAGFCYLGVLRFLEDNKFLDHIDSYVGSSIGSILAFLLCIGFNSVSIQLVIEKLTFPEVSDISVNELMEFIDTLGLKTPDRLLNILEAFSKQKQIHRDITFSQLYKKTGKKLYLTGTCINTRDVEVFSYDRYPGMKVFDAVQISITIPFFFKPVYLNGHCYVDGAFLVNCYLKILQRELKDKKAIAIDLYFPRDEECIESNKNIELWTFAKNIYLSKIHYEHQEMIDKSKDQEWFKPENTLYMALERRGINCFDFDLDEKERRSMFFYGYEMAEKFIETLEIAKNKATST